MAVASLGNKENKACASSNSEMKSTSHLCREKRICICLLCGLPGSGKTKLLRSLIHPKETCFSAMPIPQLLESFAIVGIEYDSIIPAYASITRGSSQTQEINGKWKLDRTQILSATEAIIQHIFCNSKTELSSELKPNGVQMEVWQHFSHIIDLVKTARQNNKNEYLIVIDDNMFFRSMRYEYYKLARKYQTGYCQIHVICSIEKALERNKSRENTYQVPEETILKMLGNFEVPDPEKYHWEANSLTVSSEEDISFDQIHTIIQHSIRNPVQSLKETDNEERIKSRIECSASVLHQADLILRKCVAEKMAELKADLKAERLKDMSRHIFQVKEKILHDLKDGHIHLILSKEFNITDSVHKPTSEFFRCIQDLFLMEISRL